MRVPRAWRDPIAAGRFLILSPFAARYRRPTVELAVRRNRFIAALADEVILVYAAPSSKTMELCRKLAQQGKPMLTFDSEHNDPLAKIGVEKLQVENIVARLSDGRCSR